MGFSQGVEAATLVITASIEYTILSSLWMGRQIKKLSAALLDNRVIRTLPKIFATLLVIAAHQLLPFTWQIGFWIGAGGLYVLTNANFEKSTLHPITYGSAISWLMHAIRGVDIALKTTDLLTTMGAIGLVTISIVSCASWLLWGQEQAIESSQTQ